MAKDMVCACGWEGDRADMASIISHEHNHHNGAQTVWPKGVDMRMLLPKTVNGISVADILAISEDE